jgi:glycosyltransferase involved in cell wall biosynthesis
MDPRIKIIKHEKNLGKGSAIRTGFAKVSRRYVVIQDADLEYSPTEYGTLLKPLIEGKADVVFGSRFQSSGERRVLYFWHRLGNSLLTLFSNLLTNLDLTDMETCYKVMTKEVAMALDIQENRFGLEPELTAKVASLNLRIFEVPISYNGRTYEEGKKITWRDGFSAIRCIIKYNSPRTKSKTRARYGLILNSLPMTE